MQPWSHCHHTQINCINIVLAKASPSATVTVKQAPCNLRHLWTHQSYGSKKVSISPQKQWNISLGLHGLYPQGPPSLEEPE